MNTLFQQLQRVDEKFQEYLSRGHGIFEELFEFVRQKSKRKNSKRRDTYRSFKTNSRNGNV